MIAARNVTARPTEAPPVTVCSHLEYSTRRNYMGAPTDDHEYLDAECHDCGQFVRVTIWSTREETDIRVLMPSEVSALNQYLDIQRCEEMACFGGERDDD